MSKGNILVAGGAGYIGSHFCRLAAERGFTPVVLDRLTSVSPKVEAWRRQVAKYGPLEIADMGDEESVVAIIKRHKPVAAICFAALIDMKESLADPELYWENNFYSALRFFRALELGGVRALVFSSTAAVYGNPDGGRALTEEDALAPITPYGTSKLGCEIALQGLIHHQEASDAFIEEFSRRCLKTRFVYPEFRNSFFPCLKSACLRYFNAAGADPEHGLGEVHEPETHLIPNALKGALNGQGFTLHGDDYGTPDGTCVRDYVHVLDLAEAHIAALDYVMKGGVNDAFNLGSGRGYSVKEVMQAVEQASGKSIPLTIGPRRAGDPAILVADASKAKTKLVWTPQHDLSGIIGSAAQFHREHGH
jgi:UDP-glucose 4-epimerase